MSGQNNQSSASSQEPGQAQPEQAGSPADSTAAEQAAAQRDEATEQDQHATKETPHLGRAAAGQTPPAGPADAPGPVPGTPGSPSAPGANPEVTGSGRTPTYYPAGSGPVTVNPNTSGPYPAGNMNPGTSGPRPAVPTGQTPGTPPPGTPAPGFAQQPRPGQAPQNPQQQAYSPPNQQGVYHPSGHQQARAAQVQQGQQQSQQAGQQQGQRQQDPFLKQPQPHVFPVLQDPGLGQDLSSAQLLRHTKRPPQSGWRRAVYVASGRTLNLGESATDLRRRELITRVNQPLQGCYKIAMLSLKGGVGKTTTTATLGSTFSSLRGDRVIAVDANPDRGTLSQKIPLETTATVRHLLRDTQRIRRYSDVRAYTSQGPSRLEILASDHDPAVSEAFSEQDYRQAVNLLEHFYNIMLTDCGTGLMHSAMKGVLDVADSLIIVSSSSIDGARSASATLDWLDAHGYGALVGRSVAVINSVRPGSGKVDVDKLTAHFESRCRAVARIPFDPHLEEGAEVELDQLARPTRMALLELASIVADDFPYAAGRK